MKVALYARVSSEKQAEKDLSISAQLKALRSHAEKQGWLVYREFIDEAESARSANRPAFQEMIALTKNREKPFSAILVWKLSRFARNREDSIIYKSLLKKRGITVISINEQVDDSPAGKLLEGMIEVIDEFYSRNLAQDTRRGMKENATRGFYSGGQPPVGYRLVPVQDGKNTRKKFEPDPKFAPIVKRIFDLCIKGHGAKEIMNILGRENILNPTGKAWNRNQIFAILANENYTGTYVWGRRPRADALIPLNQREVIRCENSHKPIISKQIFLKAQELLKQRAPQVVHPRVTSSNYLLSGLLFCGKCGSAMIGHSAKSSDFFYYCCNGKLKKGVAFCDSKLINRDKLERAVLNKIKEDILTENNLSELVELVNQEIQSKMTSDKENVAAIEKTVDENRSRIDRLLDALETGKLSAEEIAPRISELKSVIKALEVKRDRFLIDSTQKLPKITLVQLKQYVEDLRELLGQGSLVQRKTFLKSFVQGIEVNANTVVIQYTIPLNPGEFQPTEEVLSIALQSTP